MHEKYFLESHIASSISKAGLFLNSPDFEDMEIGDVDLINDLENYSLASDSNMSQTEIQVPSDFESVVINRLDMIVVSLILSTCFLFLLFIHTFRR